MALVKDLTGKRFNKLVVIGQAENQKKYVMWKCVCDCGNITVVRSSHLTLNKVKSCGCLNHKTKNMLGSNHRLYSIFYGMKQRCYNENCKPYKWYGKKGIAIFDGWLKDINTFFEWSLNNGYSDDLTIDRIDSSKDYEPNNCRWVTKKIQGNNTLRNKVLTYNGESMTMALWADKLKIKYYVFERDINLRHLSIEEIIKRHGGKINEKILVHE